MERKHRFRYITAIYLVILLLSILIGIISFYAGNPYQAILLNVATDLGSVVLIFIILNRFFLLDEWNINDKIESLLHKLEQQEKSSSRTFFQEYQDTISQLKSSKNISLCGITLTAVINEQFSILEERLLKGATIKILIIDPDSQAVEMAMLRSEGRDSNYYRNRVNSVLDDLRHLHKITKNSLERKPSTKNGKLSIRLLPYCPSFGIQAFDPEKDNGSINIEIFSHKSPNKSPMFELTSNRDGEWYKYFNDQFETMWANAKEWKP